jgi:hypothetical protein
MKEVRIAHTRQKKDRSERRVPKLELKKRRIEKRRTEQS